MLQDKVEYVEVPAEAETKRMADINNSKYSVLEVGFLAGGEEQA